MMGGGWGKYKKKKSCKPKCPKKNSSKPKLTEKNHSCRRKLLISKVKCLRIVQRSEDSKCSPEYFKNSVSEVLEIKFSSGEHAPGPP